jgi:hypothetical protein
MCKETQEVDKAVAQALDQLEEEYGVSRGFTSKSGAVLVMEVRRGSLVLAFRLTCCRFSHVFVRAVSSPLGMEQGVGLSNPVF